MSIFTVEAFLHDLGHKAGVSERYATARDALFQEYPLSEQERQWIVNWDVRAMHEAGVSPMLLILSYMTVHGPQGATDYLRLMGLSEEGAALASAH